MNAPRAFALAIVLASATANAQSTLEDTIAPNAHMRFDTIFAGVPRYVLTAQDGAPSAEDRYWRVISMAPLQERVTLDAAQLMDGHVEAHLAAWGAIDLAAPTADGHVAGDVAVAWIKYRRGPWDAWAGRRFIPWGAPGGVHLDGIGTGVQLGGGAVVEAIFGRPVTPSYEAILGPRPGFDGVTVAGGARLGWSHPGLLSTSVSYLEHWADGIPVRRVIEATFVATPLRWLDARGSISWDLLGFGIMQANLDTSAWLGRSVEVDVGYGHVNPELLIPRYSILSVFLTREFDEGRARLSWRVTPMVQLGLEGGAIHYNVPGLQPSQWGSEWGMRLEASVRVNTLDRRAQFVAMATQRDGGEQQLLVLRVAGSYAVLHNLLAALEGAAALDKDDFTAQRTSYYGRASVEWPFADGWRTSVSLDAVHSPIAEAELRAMVHLTATIDLRGRGR